MAATLVDEVVHFLRDDVGGVAEAQENAEILEHRKDDLFESGSFDDGCEVFDECPPPSGVGRQYVARTWGGLEFGHVRRLVVARRARVANLRRNSVRVENGINVLHRTQN